MLIAIAHIIRERIADILRGRGLTYISGESNYPYSQPSKDFVFMDLEKILFP